MWKIINNWELKSFTFAHFKTEWTARRRKAGWESKQPLPGLHASRSVTSKFYNQKSNSPAYNGMMLMNSITNLENAKSRFGTMKGASQQKMPGDSKAGKQKIN